MRALSASFAVNLLGRTVMYRVIGIRLVEGLRAECGRLRVQEECQHAEYCTKCHTPAVDGEDNRVCLNAICQLSQSWRWNAT